MNGSSGVCSEEMFSAAAVEKGREAVGKMAKKANQDVLRRIHCANLGKKRGYWEKKWAEWVMSENLEDIFPNIESLDALYSKHFPEGWDELFVEQLELSREDFQSVTGLKKVQLMLKDKYKYGGLIFLVGDIAVDILTELGFYEKMEKRGRGIVPNVTSRFAEFNTKFTIMDLVRAILWMEVGEGNQHQKPFWWTVKFIKCPSNKEGLAPLARRPILL
jgi:hypothetical protein